MEQGRRILPLSAEKKPGANGIPVLLEKIGSPAPSTSYAGFLRQGQIGDKTVTVMMAGQFVFHEEASFNLMASSYLLYSEKTNTRKRKRLKDDHCLSSVFCP